MRRGTPFPPPPPGTLFGVSPHDIPPSDFPGPPHAPFAVRNASPLRDLDFFPQPPNIEDKSEFLSGLIPSSNDPATEQKSF
ncbi:cTAGE family member 6 [Plecturocebus cupreus]